MSKRFLIGLVLVLSGLGMLTPAVWMLCSPFLAYAVAATGSGVTAWLAAVLCGLTLLVFGVRRLIPVRA